MRNDFFLDNPPERGYINATLIRNLRGVAVDWRALSCTCSDGMMSMDTTDTRQKGEYGKEVRHSNAK